MTINVSNIVTKQRVAQAIQQIGKGIPLPRVLAIIPDSVNGYWVPAGYQPTECLLVWCVTGNLFGVFRKGHGWSFYTTQQWHDSFLAPTPNELGLKVTDMALLDGLVANSRRQRPQREYLGSGTLRDALIRSTEELAGHRRPVAVH